MIALDELYTKLDLTSGDLLTATDDATHCTNCIDWLEKGEWLAAAKRAGLQSVFFVENNPVAVFGECGINEEDRINAFNRAWCLARPRLFFLASPGEITVYDLAQEPISLRRRDEWGNLKVLAILRDIGEVASELQRFHRDNIESGRIFGDSRFGDPKNRADLALIRDLKAVRKALARAGLVGEKTRFAHALIGRSIFIRYLEDRGILTKSYFEQVANENNYWHVLLNKPTSRPGIDLSVHISLYSRVLANKEFTYALFKALARDFNGDMFPSIEEEEREIEQRHLNLIQKLLYGDMGPQMKLFFDAYRFDIIPLHLISSIYEEFYHSPVDEDLKESKARQDGAYYTPAALAEFVISRVLTPEILARTPRVLDPACGSGIFLVEAFRRIVRYRWYQKSQPLTFDELKMILKNQIAGIEVNEHAARIAAFSLCLSMLHYLEPCTINQYIKDGNRLPNLLADHDNSENHYHCIIVGNAFDVNYIESNAPWKERFGKESADIVVGNPPWGILGREADDNAKTRRQVMLNWCVSNDRPIGNNESSQAFLWRTLDFLKQDGKAGMLVSASILFKQNTTTQNFRKHWTKSVKLTHVFNFTHVRNLFFKGAISPFLAIFYQKSIQTDKPVYYWSVKQTTAFRQMQTVLVSKYDMNILRDEELDNSSLWKALWFGRYADWEFIKFLTRHKPLIEFVDRKNTGRGYQTCSAKKIAENLRHFKAIQDISKYGQLIYVKPPDRVYTEGKLGAYKGLRILVKEGILENCDAPGQIVARLVDEPFCFYRSLYGIRLLIDEEWAYLVVLAILRSSLARYYFFMTSSNWGLWHHKILLEEVLRLPVILEKDSPSTAKVVSIMKNILNCCISQETTGFNFELNEANAQIRELENELDEAIFELYGLTEDQKDLIRDCCTVSLPFLYKPFTSIGAMPAISDIDNSWIVSYVHVFSRFWNSYLDLDQEMRAEIHISAHGNIVAIEAFPADKNDPWNTTPKHESWSHILEIIGNSLQYTLNSSQVLLDGVVYIITSDSIIIIKRNERRLWTRSIAREDAEATLCKAMLSQIFTSR